MLCHWVRSFLGLLDPKHEVTVIPRNLRKHSHNDSSTSQNSLILNNTAPEISNLVQLRLRALYNYKLGSRSINPLIVQNLQF